MNGDHLVGDSYQRGLGCTNGHYFNYQLWESGILDSFLYDAMEDRHFASPERIRPLGIELAVPIWKRKAGRQRADTALKLLVKTDRPEVKAMWRSLIEAIDEHDAVVANLRQRIREARGAVPVEEHRLRIHALRSMLDDQDETGRFETRSRISAAHELVELIAFGTADHVEVFTKAGMIMDLAYEDWGGTQQGITCTKWSPGFLTELAARRATRGP